MEAAEILRDQVRALEKKLDEVERDNAKQREQLREARSERDEARTRITELEAQTPKEGARILTVDEASEYDAYKALELEPAKVKEQLESYRSTRSELVQARNKDAAQKLGLKPSVLLLGPLQGAELSVTGEGESIAATVKQGDSEKPWAEWVKEKGLESYIADFAATTETPPVMTQAGRREGAPPKDPTKQVRDSLFGIK